MTPDMWLMALGFCVGLFVGGTLGLLIGGICCAGGRDDDERGVR